MATQLRPDPTFYPSPKLAMEAPREKFAFVALLRPDHARPDAIALPPPEGARHPLEAVINEIQRVSGDRPIDLDRCEGRQFVEALLDAEPNRLSADFRAQLVRRDVGNEIPEAIAMNHLPGHLARRDRRHRQLEIGHAGGSRRGEVAQPRAVGEQRDDGREHVAAVERSANGRAMSLRSIEHVDAPRAFRGER